MRQNMTIEDVVEMTGFARATIYKYVGLRSFPQPIRLGRAARWREVDIQKWIDVQAREQEKQDRAIAQLAEV